MRRTALIVTVPALLALAAVFSSGHAGSGFAVLPIATMPTVSPPTATVTPSDTPPAPAPTATPLTPYELPFAPTDVVFDPVRPYLYVSDKDGRKVYFVNLDTGLVDKEFSFELMPEALAITPDGSRLFAALLSRELQVEGEAYVAGFDLETRENDRQFHIVQYPHDMVATSDQRLIVSPGSGQPRYIKSFDSMTGAELGSDNHIGSQASLVLHPTQPALYAGASSIQRYDLLEDGGIDYARRTFAVSEAGGSLWASPVGDVLVTSGGYLFSVHIYPEDDMQLISRLTTGSWIRDVTFDQLRGLIYTAEYREVRYYDLFTRIEIGGYQLPDTPTFVGNDRDAVYAVIVQPASAQLFVLDHPNVEPCPDGTVRTESGCETPTPTPAAPTPTPCPALGCPGGVIAVDCDAGTPGIQSSCDYTQDQPFLIQVHVPQPPKNEAYYGVQAKLRWFSSGLSYLPAEDLSDELLSSVCSLPARYDEYSTLGPEPWVLYGCVPFPYQPAGITVTGGMMQFQFSCRGDGGTVRLVPREGDSQQGSHLAGANGDTFEPKLHNATITCLPDTDSDGCADGQELGPNALTGGQRNPHIFWDFFDTPNSTNTRDRQVSIIDIAGVVARFGASGNAAADPLAQPPPPPAYHTAFDRGGRAGPHLWDLAPADGVIAIGDIGGVVAQFGHSCA